MKNFLSSFRGKPLDKKQIAMGMHLCYKNAEALAGEARLLKENDHRARALSLIILALEELGEIPLIYDMILCRVDDAEAWNKAWRKFQLHKIKLGVLAIYGRRLLRVLGKGYEAELPLGVEPLADKFKQLGFYVSFFKDQFVFPEDFAKDNPEWLDWFQAILDERVASFEPLHGSLENSERFVDRAIEFITLMKETKTIGELKEELRDLILRHGY